MILQGISFKCEICVKFSVILKIISMPGMVFDSNAVTTNSSTTVVAKTGIAVRKLDSSISASPTPF